MRDSVDTVLPVIRRSYALPCPSGFRDQVEALAARRGVTVGDLARSMLLTLPEAEIARFPDPGDPAPHDRERVPLKSGAAGGGPWRRKPRLLVRMAPGLSVSLLRRALALALALDDGALRLRLEDPSLPVAVPPPAPVATRPPPPPLPPAAPAPDEQQQIQTLLAEISEENEQLRVIVGVLAFEPLPGGIRTREEALHVLGFPPGAVPDQRILRAKFRMLAIIHHPDSRYGSHQRMSQLNAAITLLRLG